MSEPARPINCDMAVMRVDTISRAQPQGSSLWESAVQQGVVAYFQNMERLYTETTLTKENKGSFLLMPCVLTQESKLSQMPPVSVCACGHNRVSILDTISCIKVDRDESFYTSSCVQWLVRRDGLHCCKGLLKDINTEPLEFLSTLSG